MADDAGALLVRSGLVPPSALDEARVRVTSQGGTLGEQLVAAGAIADDALTDFYRSRLLVPQVNPNTLARLPMKVVQTIPSDMAIELRVVPVSLDADNNLTVAMSDPSDSHAVDEIAFFTGAYVVRAVATQMQIAWCLAHYYGHITALGQRLLQPSGQASPRIGAAPPATHAPAPGPRPRGHTEQIRAMRRRAMAPIAVPRELADAAPEKPRARSVSGEIRVPVRRAPSIRPPMPEPIADDSEDSGPVITVEATPEDDTVAERMLPPRPRRPQKPNPPELAARAGEVEVQSGPGPKVVDEPRIIIEDDPPAEPPAATPAPAAATSSPEPVGITESAPTIQVQGSDTDDEVVIHARPPESEPVVLDRRHPHASAPPRPASDDDDDDDEVVVLETRKPRRTGRPERKTQVGIGVLPAVTRAARDTEAAAPSMLEDDPTGVRQLRLPERTKLHGVIAPAGPDDTSDEALAAPPNPLDVGDETSPTIAPPAPVSRPPAPVPRSPAAMPRPPAVAPAAIAPAGSGPVGGAEDDIDRVTSVMTAAELDEAIPERSADIVPGHLVRYHDHDPVDDGWGPPGTTIPPPLLGAIPGAVDDDAAAGTIPVPDVDAAPLIVTPPVPPEARGVPAPPDAAALEAATARSLELIRALEHARTRDEVLELMITHLAASHRRAGFLSIKSGELAVFQMRPRPAVVPVSALRLDRPSTLQDVVGTRLPYRGPMHDDASRNFLAAVLGACPPEILLVPVAVRDRVVGVLYGERRLRHTFDEHLALAARAAGMALERILKTKRG